MAWWKAALQQVRGALQNYTDDRQPRPTQPPAVRTTQPPGVRTSPSQLTDSLFRPPPRVPDPRQAYTPPPPPTPVQRMFSRAQTQRIPETRPATIGRAAPYASYTPNSAEPDDLAGRLVHRAQRLGAERTSLEDMLGGYRADAAVALAQPAPVQTAQQVQQDRAQTWQDWGNRPQTDILLRGVAPSMMDSAAGLNRQRPATTASDSPPAETATERYQRQGREGAERALQLGQAHSERLRAIQGFDEAAGRETPEGVSTTLAEQRREQAELRRAINDPDAFLPPGEEGSTVPGRPDIRVNNPEARRRFLQSRVTQLTQEQYDELNDREKAAVQFNTGLAAASLADDEAGNTYATRNYLSRLGIVSEDEEDLDSFLQLDRLIGTTIMERLNSPATSGSDAYANELLRQRGSPSVLLQDRIGQARKDTDRAALALSELLSQRGFGNLDETTAGQSGFDTTGRDHVIMEAYFNMIDSNHNLTSQDVVDGLAYMNQAYGTDVTAQEVWDFAASQLQAQDFAREGGTGRGLRMGASGPETPQLVAEGDVNPYTGEQIIPLSPEEIRERYNL